MLSAFILCCNFCACKCACTVVVRSPTEGWGTVTWQPSPRGWWGTVFPGVGNDKGGGGTNFHVSGGSNVPPESCLPLGQPILTSRILILKPSAFGTAHFDIQDRNFQTVRLWDGPS